MTVFQQLRHTSWFASRVARCCICYHFVKQIEQFRWIIDFQFTSEWVTNLHTLTHSNSRSYASRIMFQGKLSKLPFGTTLSCYRRAWALWRVFGTMYLEILVCLTILKSKKHCISGIFWEKDHARPPNQAFQH